MGDPEYSCRFRAAREAAFEAGEVNDVLRGGRCFSFSFSGGGVGGKTLR